jgi:hypothetical protein
MIEWINRNAEHGCSLNTILTRLKDQFLNSRISITSINVLAAPKDA